MAGEENLRYVGSTFDVPDGSTFLVLGDITGVVEPKAVDVLALPVSDIVIAEEADLASDTAEPTDTILPITNDKDLDPEGIPGHTSARFKRHRFSKPIGRALKGAFNGAPATEIEKDLQVGQDSYVQPHVVGGIPVQREEAVALRQYMNEGASGGGGGIISTPLMVILGLPPATAIATAKFGGFGMSLGSSSRFYKEKIADKRTVIIFSIIGGIGALIGSVLLVQFSDHSNQLQKIMGFAILIVGIPTLYFRNTGLVVKSRPTWLKAVGRVLLGLGVVVQVALGSGIGSLQLIVLISCFGMTALVASATRRFMQLTVASISLIIFVLTGLVDYRYGVVVFITALAGGYIGTHIAIKKGNKFVINLFAAVSALMALELIVGR